MSEENKTQETQELQAPEITSDAVTKFAEENNQVLISRQDFARVIEGEEPENAILKKTFAKLANAKHGEVSKKVKTDVESHVMQVTGIEKQEGESVFDLISRATESLKTSSKDAGSYKEALESKQKRISELEAKVSEFSVKEKKNSFESEFKISFEEEISKYGDLNAKRKARLFKDLSNDVYSSRKELEDGTVEYRKGRKIVDENANEYNEKSLIHSFMSEYGYDMSKSTTTTPDTKKGAPQTKKTVIEKDDQDTRTAHQKAYAIVTKRMNGKFVNEHEMRELVKIEVKKIRENQ